MTSSPQKMAHKHDWNKVHEQSHELLTRAYFEAFKDPRQIPAVITIKGMSYIANNPYVQSFVNWLG